MRTRIAETKEFDKVLEFYDKITEQMKDMEFSPGWTKDLYPTQDFLRESLAKGELYIGETDEEIVAAMVLNHEVTDGYEKVNWKIDAEPEEVLVVHVLGVLPSCHGKGYGKDMVRLLLDIAKERGMKAVRLDVLEGNLPPMKLYTGLGFEYIETLELYYEDTGLTNYLLYEYIF